ncbi:alpha-L-fucosidase [Streptacidiphilus sp. MAP5-3]|uniref:alpha-L-fucosidase n=1 Tax=unclassified Streptacidiphilus TaxID=2643834 RepID=UPI003513D40D
MTAVPSPQQLAWQQAGFALFLHFGINTFHGKEWSDGTLDPVSFDPSELDARQWAQTAKDAGASHVVLTAKHHDGFCLWPTATTTYSVASSPWRGGHGDVVRELAEACREAGIGLGLYLSPWDRNAASSPDPEAYDAFYVQQLTELCTRYGPLAELWFDGAGSQGRAYDWDAIMAVVDEHQPDAMVFNMGRPTVRWVGNEDGLAEDPCWYVTDSVGVSIYDQDATPLGTSRYLPPECDVAIRRHWFWQPDDLHTLKSREHLLAIWYRSVGLGAGLLLNVPPDRRGQIDPADQARLLEFTDEVARRFANPVRGHLTAQGGSVHVGFDEPVMLDHLELIEDLTDGQHITRHRILANGLHEIAAGQSVGIRRVHAFPETSVSHLRIELTGRHGALLAVVGHRTGHTSAPALEEQQAFMSDKIDDQHLLPGAPVS